MGTKSITNFYDGDTYQGSIIRWMDGYLEAQGKDLKNILAGKRVIPRQKTWKTRRGYNSFRNLINDVYRKLKKANCQVEMDNDPDWRLEYVYTIRIKAGKIFVSVDHWGLPIILECKIEDMPVKTPWMTGRK